MFKISLFVWIFIIFITYSFLLYEFGVSRGTVIGRKEMLEYYNGGK